MIVHQLSIDARKLLREQDADNDEINVNKVPRKGAAGKLKRKVFVSPKKVKNCPPEDVDELREHAEVNVELKYSKKVCE